MPRVKKEVVEEEVILEESFEEALEKLQPVEEKSERKGKVLFIAKGYISLSSIVNGVECGFSIPLNEQNKNVKPGDLIIF